VGLFFRYPRFILGFPRNSHTLSSQIPDDFARVYLRSKRSVSPGSNQGRFFCHDKPSPPRVGILEHRACVYNRERIRNRPPRALGDRVHSDRAVVWTRNPGSVLRPEELLAGHCRGQWVEQLE
jgi:hypothetical protein